MLASPRGCTKTTPFSLSEHSNVQTARCPFTQNCKCRFSLVLETKLSQGDYREGQSRHKDTVVCTESAAQNMHETIT